MKIIDGIKIDWHHDVPNKTTSCVLTATLTNGTLSFEKEFVAVAKCGHGDQFSRKAGRKLSLTRVLKIADLPKNLRTEVWSVIWGKGVKV